MDNGIGRKFFITAALTALLFFILPGLNIGVQRVQASWSGTLDFDSDGGTVTDVGDTAYIGDPAKYARYNIGGYELQIKGTVNSTALDTASSGVGKAVVLGGNTAGETKGIIKFSNNEPFTLRSIDIFDYCINGSENLKISTSKGTAPIQTFSTALSATINLAGNPAFQDITYVEITNNSGGAFSALEVDNLLMGNIPTVTLSGSGPNYIEGGTPVSVDSGLTINNSDSIALTGAVVTVDNPFSGDVLSFTNDGSTMGDITGFYNSVNRQLTLSSPGGTITTAQLQSALRSVSFLNTSDDPDTAVRNIGISLGYGGLYTAAVTKTVSITSVNDPPTLTATPTNPAYTENGSAVSLFTGTSISTVEAGQSLKELTLTVSSIADGASEILNIDGTDVTLTNGNSGTTAGSGAAYSVSVSGSTATVTLIGNFTAPAMQNIVNGITYRNTSFNPTIVPRLVTLTSASDNGGTANGGADTAILNIVSIVMVIPVNDAPVISTSGGSASFTEKTPVAIDSGITVSDPDNITLASATVSITGNYQSGEDNLNFTNDGSSMGDITGSYNSSTGVLTLTSAGASATLAQWQAALRSVQYSNSSSTPSTATRTASYTVNDGTSSSAAATRSITVTAVNDAPQISLPGSITINAGTLDVINGVSFSDADAGANTVSAAFSASSGTLAATSGGGVTASGSGTLTITLTGTVANINAFIDSGRLTYLAIPNNYIDKTIQITINDSGNTGIGGAKSASLPLIVQVNKAIPSVLTVPPSSVTSTGANAGGLLLSDGGSAITEMGIEYKKFTDTAYTGVTIAAPFPGMFNTSLSGLEPNTLYVFRAYAKNAIGTGYGPNNLFTTAAAVPDSLTATIGDSKVNLSWNSVAGATEYWIYQRTSSGSFGTTPVATVTATTYSVTGLNNGTIYVFAVKAKNAIGLSDYSNEVSITPMTFPGAPANVTAAAGDTQAVISFTPPASDGGSTIWYIVTSSPGGITASAASGPITITGLTNGTSYTFTVKAVNSVGSGTESASSNSVTPTHILTDWEAVAADTSSLNIGYVLGDSEASVTQNITLPVTGPNGTNIVWNSSNPAFISVSGEVYRPAYTQSDVAVTVTASVYRNAASSRKSFVLNVKNNVQTDQEAVTADITVLAIGYAPGDSQSSVTQNIILPAAGSNGTSIKWISSNVSYISPEGVVTRPEATDADKNVTVTASVYKSGFFLSRDFNITVKKIVPETLAIISGSLPDGTVGVSYSSTTVSASGGLTPYIWTASGLPAGLNINTVTGAVYGTPTLSGTFTVHITVKDSMGLNVSKDFTITVKSNYSGSSGSVTVPAASDILGQVKAADGKILGDVKITLDKSTGAAVLNIDINKLNSILAAVKADDNGRKTMILSIPEIEGANIYNTNLPAEFFTEQGGNRQITINTDIGTVTLQGSAIDGTAMTGVKNVSLSIASADSSGYSSILQESVGSRPAIRLDIGLDNKTASWSNDSSPVIVSIPYIPSAAELSETEHITVYYIDKSGNGIPVTSGRYNADAGCVTFTATYSGEYAVAFVKKTFNDLKDFSWAEKQIEILASKGVINGTSGNTFSPAEKITRGDFITLLAKVLGLSGKVEENFSDIKPEDYYYNAVGLAKKLGICKGDAEGLFNANDYITREDMMVLVERALRLKGVNGNNGTSAELVKFTDSSAIAGYARQSVSNLIKEGLIQGNGESIDPLGNTSRSEVAVLLYRIYNKLYK